MSAAAFAALPFAPASAEDGYDLWLRYAPLEGEALERMQEFNPLILSVSLQDPDAIETTAGLASSVTATSRGAGDA